MNNNGDHPVHDEIGCLEAIETLYAYLDGDIEGEITLAQIEHHLNHCRSCYSRKELEQALTAHLKASKKASASEALKGRLRELMDGF
jgi:anti-sigma factor (TIGR02949 family)